MNAAETGYWAVRYRLAKYHEDVEPFRGRESEFLDRYTPYEVIEGDGNILVNTGIALLEDLLIGAGGTVFSNANAYLGVGDSTTAAAASQTDLQAATNKTRKAMDATYPSRSAQTLTFRSTFGSSDANHGWKEWGTFNASTAGTMLNRKVTDFGTKTTGTWALQITIIIS